MIRAAGSRSGGHVRRRAPGARADAAQFAGQRDQVCQGCLRVLRERNLVAVTDGTYAVNSAELPVLRYYANSLAHLFAYQSAEKAA